MKLSPRRVNPEKPELTDKFRLQFDDEERLALRAIGSRLVFGTGLAIVEDLTTKDFNAYYMLATKSTRRVLARRAYTREELTQMGVSIGKGVDALRETNREKGDYGGIVVAAHVEIAEGVQVDLLDTLAPIPDTFEEWFPADKQDQ
jgi:hypothetical protein